jgi:hypothetical protein
MAVAEMRTLYLILTIAVGVCSSCTDTPGPGLRTRRDSDNATGEAARLRRWLSQYKGELFDPPVTFDVREATQYDFRTPVAALRSHWHALYKGDAQALLANADQVGAEFLRNYYRLDAGKTGRTYLHKVGPTELVQITPLFQGETTLNGTEYAIVYYRCQGATRPEEGIVSLQGTLLSRDTSGRYRFSLEATIRGSEFASILGLVPNSQQWYQNLLRRLQTTDLPKHFYLIEKREADNAIKLRAPDGGRR